METNTNISPYTQLEKAYASFWQTHTNAIGLTEDLLKDGQDAIVRYEPLIVCAASRGAWDLVKALTLCGADVNATCIDNYPASHQRLAYSTALHYAALEGQADVVALLLKHGADPNCVDYDLNTPLMKCFLATTGKNTHNESYTATISLLLKHGADTNIENTQGISAMHFARRVDGRSRLKKVLPEYLTLETSNNNNNGPSTKRRKLN